MISQAAADESLAFVYMMLAAASAGVFLHAGIKFPWFVFFQKDSGLRPKDAPWNMGVAMVIFAVLCILIGVAPELLYRFLPYPVEYEAYSASKVLFYLQLLLFSGLAFFLLLPLMKRTETISLDTDWLWRVALYRTALGLSAAGRAIGGRLSAVTNGLLARLQTLATRHLALGNGGERGGVFARAWPIGSTALWIAVLLTAYILFYYF
jgi:multicomponent Na+:H+ antiporter subunit D